MPKHYDDITSVLSTLEHLFGVVAFSAMWLNTKVRKEFYIEGYSLESKSCNDRRGGGVTFAIRHDIKYIVRNDILVFNPLCESLFIEVVKPGKNVIGGVFYRPPDQSQAHFIDIKELETQLATNYSKQLPFSVVAQ